MGFTGVEGLGGGKGGGLGEGILWLERLGLLEWGKEYRIKCPV